MSDLDHVAFYRLISAGRPPKRADRSAAGLLPSRAMRYCEAITSATGFGYWIFPPMTFRLCWDGERIVWSFGEDEEWQPLSESDSGAVQFPHFESAFDAFAPPLLHGYAPPFLTASLEPGAFQMWTGLIAKTRPGWSLNVRAPVNLPQIPGLVTWEGLIETDIWTGPLIGNFRILKTDQPVLIRADTPVLHVQPMPQMAYRDSLQADFTLRQAEDLAERDWEAFANVLLPPPEGHDRQGDYAVMVRRRRACPVDPGLLPPESKRS